MGSIESFRLHYSLPWAKGERGEDQQFPLLLAASHLRPVPEESCCALSDVLMCLGSSSFYFFCLCPVGLPPASHQAWWNRRYPLHLREARHASSSRAPSPEQMAEYLPEWCFKYCIFHPNNTRARGHSVKQKCGKFKTEKRKYSFTQCVARLWNLLLQEVVEAKNLA